VAQKFAYEVQVHEAKLDVKYPISFKKSIPHSKHFSMED
jgi:hypothetical protein